MLSTVTSHSTPLHAMITHTLRMSACPVPVASTARDSGAPSCALIAEMRKRLTSALLSGTHAKLATTPQLAATPPSASV